MSASFVADTWLDLAGETVGRGPEALGEVLDLLGIDLAELARAVQTVRLDPDMAPHAQADDALIEAARHLRLASEYLQGAGAVLGFDGVRGPRA